MKKVVFCLFLVVFSINTYSQDYLSGEVIVTNPRRASVALNHEMAEGSVGTFSYDGKELSLKFGKEVFGNVKVATGFGFKPNGELCFYASLEDGIEIGTIRVEGTGHYCGKSLKIYYNPSLKQSYCVSWVTNTSFRVTPEKSGFQKMIIRPKVSNSFIPKLLLYNKVELESSVVLKETEEDMIEAYCLERDKEVPAQGVRFTYGVDSSSDIEIPWEGLIDEPSINQELLYNYIDGYSITENNIISLWKGEKSTLLFLDNLNIIKYANGEFASSIPLPIEHLRKTLNVENMLQNKIDNMMYFCEHIDNAKIPLLKLVFIFLGFKANDDDTMTHLYYDNEQYYDEYSKAVVGILMQSSSILQSIQGGITDE